MASPEKSEIPMMKMLRDESRSTYLRFETDADDLGEHCDVETADDRARNRGDELAEIADEPDENHERGTDLDDVT